MLQNKKIKSNHVYQILKLLRVRQWIKNLALYAAITFGGQLFNQAAFMQVTWGFIAFSCIASATYIANDIVDAAKDRLHPFKKNRPIASGRISIPEAVVIFIILLVVGFGIALSLNPLFTLLLILYVSLQILYSLKLKSVVILDIMVIAAGYIIRVFAGDALSGYHISVWLILTTISLSLFLAIGKRRSELTLLKSHQGTKIDEIRMSLSHYSEKLLDAFIAMFAASTFMFYAMFTFIENSGGMRITFEPLLPEFLPFYLQRKWLMITIIPVIYGLMKYLQIIYEKSEGESPDRVLLSDKSLLAGVTSWVLLVIFILYFLS